MPSQRAIICQCKTCRSIARFEKKVEKFMAKYPITHFEVTANVCPQCGRIFRSSRIYNGHIRGHCDRMERVLRGKFVVIMQML